MLALVLALVMCASVCACGGKKTQTLTNDLSGLTKVKLENVYTAQPLKTDIKTGDKEGSGENIDSVTYIGTDLYITTGYYNESQKPDGTYDYEYGSRLYKADSGSGATEMLKTFKAGYSYDEKTMIGDSTYYGSFTPMKDGSLWYVKTVGHEDGSDPNNYVWENKSVITHEAADGTELASIDSSEFMTGEYDYINRMAATPDGGLVIQSESGFYILDSAGALKSKIPMDNENSWVQSTFVCEDGTVIGTMYSYNQVTYDSKTELFRLDPVQGKLETLGDMLMENAYNICGFENDTLYMSNGVGVYACDINAGTSKEILNWLNSDINGSRINSLTLLDDGRFFMSEYDRNYGGQNFYILTKASEGDVTEKYIVNLASLYLSDELREAILKFNRQNDEFRIAYKDYSVYQTEDNWNAGLEQLHNDMISGNIPDIIMTNGLNIDSYISKGLLADIGILIDVDEEFSREDYFENILTAHSKTNKVYTLIPSFSIQTYMGLTEVVGDKMGWTFDDVNRVMEQYPDAQLISETTSSSLLYSALAFCLDEFVDFETGKCSFDSEGFIKLLEFANKLPKEIDYDKLYSDEAYWRDYENQYKNKKTLIQAVYLSDIWNYKYTEYGFGGDTTFIGFPTENGIGSVIVPQDELAISASTKLPETCWDFIKYMLSEECQENLDWCFPILRSAFDKGIELAMEGSSGQSMRYFTTPDGGGVEIVETESGVANTEVESTDASGGDLETADDSTSGDTTEDTDGEADDADASGGDLVIAVPDAVPADNGDYYEDKPLTQKQADKIKALVEAVNTVTFNYSDLMTIIEEETGAFFEGQKTAQEVASLIQSRASIFISENR